LHFVNKHLTLTLTCGIIEVESKKKMEKKQTKEEECMQTSEEEFQADLDAQDMRYSHYCREQEEMYNDPVMNWSGLR